MVAARGRTAGVNEHCNPVAIVTPPGLVIRKVEWPRKRMVVSPDRALRR
jgi:hypothetical protein